MKKIILVITTLVSLTFAAQAQSNKVVFHLASEDTLVHKNLVKQLNNIMVAEPDLKIEVVCHGPGIFFLMREKSIVQGNIHDFINKGVKFAACENTMKERKIARDQVIAGALFVPSALIEIIHLQKEGWSYIKAGF
jgi:uncharacterized protein